MANHQRGEVTLVLNGERYTLRPTFESMCEIEERLDCSMLALIRKFQNRDLRFNAIATVVWAGIHGFLESGFKPSAKPTFNEIGNAIRNHGMDKLLSAGTDEGTNPLINFITRGVMGDEEVEAAEEEVGSTEETEEAAIDDADPKSLKKAKRRTAGNV
jgi:hypothetical protein